jgi:hypothetical protein
MAKEIGMKHLQSRRGGIISGLLFAGMMVFLVMLLAAVVVTRSVHVKSIDGINGRDVAILVPGGRLSIRTRDHMDPAIVGVPVYPGASRTDDSGGAHFEWSSSDGRTDKNLYVVGGEFHTKDPASDVVEFYRRQLPSLMIVSEKDNDTRLEYKDGGIKRIISIHEKNGETRIGVASVGGRESN